MTFTVGSITVFIALMNAPNAGREALATLTKILLRRSAHPAEYHGARSRTRSGQYIHNIYGLTETTSPSHAVPLGASAPVDEASGALSVGVPVYSTVVRIVGEDDRDLPAGEIGELVTDGPAGRRRLLEQARGDRQGAAGRGAAHRRRRLHGRATAGFISSTGRRTRSTSSGYKVWPREVEDVLYEHEAVREAAVVGVPDPYRGETVKAYVSLKPGRTTTPEELIAHCKQNGWRPTSTPGRWRSSMSCRRP